MRLSQTVRSLHLAIVGLVLFQLLSEQLLKIPKPGEQIDPVEALFLQLHEWNGFIVLGIVVIYLMHLADDWKRLFPWMSAQGCKEVWQEICTDIPGWFKGKLKTPAQAHYIASTVHGLGILLLLALGSTGIMVFMGLEPNGNMDKDTKLLKDLHSDLGDLIWIYLLAHAGMALIHQCAGHRIFQDIFSFKSDDGSDDRQNKPDAS